MADGKHCPLCRRDIGVWPIFSAGLPSRIRCPHCSARLGYRGIVGVVVILILVMAIVVVGSLYLASVIPGVPPSYQLFTFAAIWIGLWAVIELAVARFLRGNRELISRDRVVTPSQRPDVVTTDGGV